MILISEIYEDVALDSVNTPENGQLNYAMFNRLSRRAELRFLDYLSGDVEGIKPPVPYTTQKVKDVLSKFIAKAPVQVTNGEIAKPSDYYGYENLYVLGSHNDIECEEEVEDKGVPCNIPIELLDGAKFTSRCKTKIEGLEPSFHKPIAKLLGNVFEFLPRDLGSITLEYVRLPVFGRIVEAWDAQFHQPVVDTALSVNYEWDESAREALVFFICQQFAVHTREKALLESAMVTKPSGR